MNAAYKTLVPGQLSCGFDAWKFTHTSFSFLGLGIYGNGFSVLFAALEF